MDNIVNVGVLLEDLIQSGLIGDINIVESGALATDELDAIDDLLRRIVEIIDNYNLVIGFEERENCKGTNIAGSSVSISMCPSLLFRGRLPSNKNRSNDHCDLSCKECVRRKLTVDFMRICRQGGKLQDKRSARGKMEDGAVKSWPSHV